ncbi:hypothetical protein L6164_037474 [Bauhinia variegata]|uniref:Uncharacterized protein n=1 Tax=Bauhinia variegata TaxID=167791 RepID=A0ACB9KKG6_BAUVA|nr:hypothetical protein L6164_037474 [Bauhinia variegata]
MASGIIGIALVVKEFFANKKDRRNHTIYVRGHWVAFDRTSINHVYGLADIEECEYFSRIRHLGIHFRQLVQFFISPGAKWKLTPNEAPKHFSKTTLSMVGKAWQSFINARLMPT